MFSLITIAITGVLLLYLGFLKNRWIYISVAITGLITALAFSVFSWNSVESSFSNMLIVNNYAVAFNSLMIFTTLLIFLLAPHYFKGIEKNVPEIYALLIFSLAGACMVTSFDNLTMLFIGIETMSIPLYILAGSKKFSIRSNEASFKYFIFSSLATAIFLLGITLVYGMVGSFHVGDISNYFTITKEIPSILKVGIVLLVISFGFKIAAVPFHFWAPDVYEGSPTLITAFMATVVKIAGFAAFYKLLSSCFILIPDTWHHLILGLSVLSLIVGNVGAIKQKDVKRMLAYSSISHTGFMLFAVLSFNTFSASSLLYYSFAYALSTIAAFGVLMVVKNHMSADGSIEAFNGLAKKNPILAIVMTISMLSMAGIPVTSGFFAKYYIFVSAIQGELLWMVIVGIIAALVGVAYYLKLIIAMFAKTSETEKIVTSPLYVTSLLVAAILILIAGILPNLIVSLI
ncbi:MAG: NADH-quinone oxidoreductase subunit N [Bacteroidia bacterium]|nr:NADH-quinone oxidoreductase subunit N [Bacteroidia bacterium]